MTQYPPPQPVYSPSPMPAYPPPLPARSTSGLAVAGFVCSVIFCIPGLGVIGAVLSFVGLFATGASAKRGRGLAIAGLIVGLLATGGWIAAGVGIQAMASTANEPIDSFLADYNKGDDRAIYDRSSPEFKTACSYPKLHEILGTARSQWGKAERMGMWEMATNGGFNVQMTNHLMVVNMPLKFEKIEPQEVEWKFQREGGDWKLIFIRFPTLTYAQTQPE